MSLIPAANVPPGQSGNWRVFTTTLTEADAKLENVRMAFSGERRYVRAGTYTVLAQGPTVVMSDTPAEKQEHYEPARRAVGRVLINGLGLGLIARACLAKPEIESVTVIELSPDVIALTAPHVVDPRLEIIQADAYTWEPPRGLVYDVVWHDIWPTISSENLAQMAKLHRKYARRCRWQGSWAKEECQYMRRREREREAAYRGLARAFRR